MERITHNGTTGVFCSDEELAMLGLAYIGASSPSPKTSKKLKLLFFVDYDTEEKQQVLTQAVLNFISKACPKDGKDFSPLYIANSYHTNELKLNKNYAGFFHDIDLIAPQKLNKVHKNQKTNQERYKSYCQSLPNECKKWFIDNGCLPPLCEWTTPKYVYQVKDDKRKETQLLTIELLKELQCKGENFA